MAYKITDLDGGTTGATTAYPYGDVMDDPGGTRVNRKMLDDLLQFAHRLMSDAAIVPNSTPDNATNGYQLVQALYTAINQESSAWATTVGAQAGSTQPVRLYGCSYTTVSGHYVIAQGWVFYNGYLCYCPAQTVATPGGGYVQATVSFADGLPTIMATAVTLVTTDSTHFGFSAIENWSTAVGIDAINTAITSLQTTTGTGSWTNITPATGWSAGSLGPQYRKDGYGKIYLRGSVVVSTGTPTVIGTLPSGSWPPVTDMYFPATAYVSGSDAVKKLHIDTSGVMTALLGPYNTGDVFILDGISFFNS